MTKKFAFILFYLCFQQYFRSETIYIIKASADTAELTHIISEVQSSERPNPIFHLFKRKQERNKKITAAILAFPFPFGIVGLHRIYLGTAPHVPVVYIGTLGGVFGILPFIDFCVLVLDKNIDRYISNSKVLMWVDENTKATK